MCIRDRSLGALNGEEKWVNQIMALMDAVDSYIPTPERTVDLPFLMPIEDVFTITGRGTVVTGRVERGIIKVGEEVEIVGIKPTTKTTCTGVEMFRKLLDQGQAGDNITMSVELIHPIAMEVGLRFAIREGGRTVASGVVSEITK